MSSPSCTSCDSINCYINKFALKAWKQKAASDKSTSHYKKGEIIFREGDPVTGIYFIYDGKVKVYNSGNNNKTQIVRFGTSGKILGHRGFGKITNYPIGATAIEAATICYIPKATFIKILENNPKLALELLNFYADELRRAENKLRSLSQMTVKQKVAEAILTLGEVYGLEKNNTTQYLSVQLSRQEYADITGASIEEVIRTLSQLKNEKLITLEGKRIGILNQTKLQEMLAEFGPLRLP
jgi:CRP-like cAMP-binding protein